MFQKTEFIWFDGKLVPWDQAQVHVLAHGLHYGTGVFEGIRAYACPDGSSAVFRLPEHSKRLVNSDQILGIDMPIPPTKFQGDCRNRCGQQAFRRLHPSSRLCRRGRHGRVPQQQPHARHHRRVALGRLPRSRSLEKGIRVKTSSFARMHVNTLMSKAKAAGNYVNSVLAKMEVKQDGYDEA